MKEATGELNMTVITIVAIGAILAVFTIFLLPTIKKSIQNRQYCTEAICPDTCDSDGKHKCMYYDGPSDEVGTPIYCKCTPDANAGRVSTPVEPN